MFWPVQEAMPKHLRKWESRRLNELVPMTQSRKATEHLPRLNRVIDLVLNGLLDEVLVTGFHESLVQQVEQALNSVACLAVRMIDRCRLNAYVDTDPLGVVQQGVGEAKVASAGRSVEADSHSCNRPQVPQSRTLQSLSPKFSDRLTPRRESA